jgi:hypothetical protein
MCPGWLLVGAGAGFSGLSANLIGLATKNDFFKSI